MPLTSYSYDNFVAPEMSRFTFASIRDMTGISAEQEGWLYNFMLNTLFRANLVPRD